MDDNESLKKQQIKSIDEIYGFNNVKIEQQDKIAKTQKLDETIPFDSVNAKRLNPKEFQTIFNTKIAGELAITLWIMLGLTIGSHLINIYRINSHMLNSSSDKETEVIESASNLLNSQYSNIYAFLGTLTASVTAFYFVSVGNIVNKQQE
ncbi:MAG: hypothetical protein HC930_11615 [Hydrococcus sp. SU_1_0]|nr:hypothetical protein [Hydrococcus sp. SU_1_0]